MIVVDLLTSRTFDTKGIEAFCRTVLAVTAVVGLVVRFILLPYLKEHIVTPVSEVREQVKNSHKTNLRNDVDDGNKKTEELAERVEDLVKVVDRWRAADAQRWREHMAYSEKIDNRVERIEGLIAGEIDQN